MFYKTERKKDFRNRKMWYEVINSKWKINKLQLPIYTHRHSELNDMFNANL